MVALFAEFAKPGGGDERPYGIRYDVRSKPFVVAHFIGEEPMPVEMGLLAADLLHNTRVALDHILARLKDQFGGNPRPGGFPTWQTEELWQEQVVNAGRRSALHSLDHVAVDLIYDEQPLHRTPPGDDPLVTLNKLDNADKHHLLYPAFVYPGVNRGLDLIEVRPGANVTKLNVWNAGDPLEDGSVLAKFIVRGNAKQVLRVRRDAPIGFAAGELTAVRMSYTDIIDRVRAIADRATALIDSRQP
jgi:hypothetical protein